jgi:hypothetical protein
MARSPLYKYHTLSHDRFLPTDRPDLFARFGLHSDLVDVDSQDFRDSAADRCFVRTELRPLREDDAVQIVDRVTRLRYPLKCQSQHLCRVTATIRLIRIREQLADIAECGRTQKRIGDCVQQHIRVTVPDQMEIVWDLDSAQTQRAAVTKPVRIMSDANT